MAFLWLFNPFRTTTSFLKLLITIFNDFIGTMSLVTLVRIMASKEVILQLLLESNQMFTGEWFKFILVSNIYIIEKKN